VGAVQDSIADSISDRRIGEEVVPAIVFELARDDRRAEVVAVFEDLEEVAPSTGKVVEAPGIEPC